MGWAQLHLCPVYHVGLTMWDDLPTLLCVEQVTRWQPEVSRPKKPRTSTDDLVNPGERRVLSTTRVQPLLPEAAGSPPKPNPPERRVSTPAMSGTHRAA